MFAAPPMKSARVSHGKQLMVLVNRLGPNKRILLFGVLGAAAFFFCYLSFNVAVGFLGSKEEAPSEEVQPDEEAEKEAPVPAEEAPPPENSAPKIPSFPALPSRS